ncbi:hypothetical protein L6Q96_07855 [Candidatus Binatia bacterium]|nr:hypothetical protein [Candidatus Binatia bacterium]
MSGDGSGSAAVAKLVAEAAAGKARRAYLFVGESAATRAAAEALVNVLVPPARRSFNLEVYDGRSAAFGRVVDSARTPGFFAGAKVIWVRESPAFLAAEKRPDVTKALLAAWDNGRELEAAEKLMALVALAGWSDEQFREARWEQLSKTRIREVFGGELDGAQLAAVRQVQSACVARDLRAGDYRDEGTALADLLEGGDPGGAILLFTAAAADARKRVVKRLAEVGAVVDLTVARERSGTLAEDAVTAIVREVTATFRKQLSPAALALLRRRAGSDPAALAGEVEKVCLYAGDRAVIDVGDVSAVVRDMGESWIFDFTSALAARQLPAAVSLLRDLLGQGEPPLRLLAMVARELRLLLLARESLDSELRGLWRTGLAFPQFQSRVLPHLDGATREAFGPAHPYVLYRRFQDAERTAAPALRGALVDLAELDRRLKSSAGLPALLLEAFVMRWCATQVGGAR